MLSQNIDHYIEAVSKIRLPNVFNPWGEDCQSDLQPGEHKRRQIRLKQHMDYKNPAIVCVGESPGYQGCRRSGIAFCSEHQVINGMIPRVADMQGQRISSRPSPWKEPSATIVWKALYRTNLAEKCVLTNAQPFHPMGPKGIDSNRTPTSKELDMGLEFLEMFLNLYPGAVVCAVGRNASENLNKLNIEHAILRHPANGGATLFNEGLDLLIHSKSL